MIAFEIGLLPILVTVILGAVCVVLFVSMRHQMRRIDIPDEGVEIERGQHEGHAQR